MHYKRSIRLTRMHSWTQYHSPSLCYLFRSWCEISNYHHFTIIPGYCFAQYSFPNLIFSLRCAYFSEVLAAVTVRVGIAVRKEHFIVIVFELSLKAEGEVEPAALLLHRILEVADVLAVSLPADPRLIVGLFLRVDEGLHALVVRALRLD